MSSIKITSRPTGKAPEWVRDAWIGMEMSICGMHDPSVPLIGVDLGKAAPENKGGYLVSFETAMRELKRHNLKAFQWWESSPIYGLINQLVFGEYCCEYLA